MTVKKNAPAAASPIAQSAAERRAAEVHLRTLIDKHVPEHVRLIGSLRRSLRTRLPTAHEVVYEYRDFIVISLSPSGRGFEGVLAIRASAEDVRLYFNRGKDLPDPEKRLRGASMARFVAIEAASTVAQPAIAALIDHAIYRNDVPFETAGKGSVFIRQATTKPASKPAKAAKKPARKAAVRPATPPKRTVKKARPK